MRRSLVLTDETARHPFLATLPPHVRQAGERGHWNRRLRLSADDVRSFLFAYFGSLVAVALFIS